MFHMLSCFDIRSASNLAECQALLRRYAEHMQQLGLITGSDPIGARQNDTILDTDEDRDQQYFHLMHFRDRAQADRAVKHIESLQEPSKTLHRDLYTKLENLVFVCWADT
ncbi:MAG: hypothetical protein AAGA91_14850 [Pseudomonadota bacterium]